ncbi:survival protein sure-like phosphatase/nucleotidase, partial [Piptocephalis cylindrospora]
LRLLVTNDDGPPGSESPFVAEFIQDIVHAHPHPHSVCLPSCQKSWISKAHLITETLHASLYDPVTGLTKELTEEQIEGATMDPAHWVFVSGTPAACVNIALHHLHTKAPFDAVISGPNVGMNSGTTYSLSSGTIGAALEASLNGLPAIAVSYGYTSPKDIRSEDRVTLAHAKAMKVIDHLLQGEVWPEGALYNVNIPL